MIDLRLLATALPVLVAVVVAASAIDRTQRALTVQETLDVVFGGATEGEHWSLYPLASVDARDTLRGIARDSKTDSRYRIQAWRALGFIGDVEDVRSIRQLATRGYAGLLTDDQRAELSGAIDCLGILYGRDIQGAEELFRELIEPDFWRSRPYQWSSEPEAIGYPVAINHVLTAYAYSGRMELGEPLGAVARSVNDPERRKYFEWRIRHEQLSKLHRVVRREPDATEVERSLRAVKGSFNGDLENPGPATPPTTTRPTTHRTSATDLMVETDGVPQVLPVVTEALTEFDKIRGESIEGGFERVAPRLLDGGTRIVRADNAEGREAFDGAIRPILSDPRVLNAKPGRAEVEYRFPSPDAKGAEIVYVRVTLEGTNELVRTHPQLRTAQGDTVSSVRGEPRSLVIVMIKRDGAWYWWPFGW
jgi:hypothetical protein